MGGLWYQPMLVTPGYRQVTAPPPGQVSSGTLRCVQVDWCTCNTVRYGCIDNGKHVFTVDNTM